MKDNVGNTYLTDTIKVSPTTSYDENAKELLSDKHLLAHILAGVVEEFEGWEIEEIIPCIDGEPMIGRVLVDSTPCISGSNTEDIVINEGKITYDIRFNVIIPLEDKNTILSIKLLIDVEMQTKSTGLGYSLLNRATYSASRMVSSQNNKEFINPNFDDLKKVYSIWICANPRAKYRNTILKYYLKEDVLFGRVKPSNIKSLLNIVMINLDGNGNYPNDEEEKPTLVGLLNTIFTSPLNSDEKIKRLEDIYNIPKTEKIREGVVKMCNLSTGILEKGREEGLAQGRAEGKAEGLAEGKIIGTIEALHSLGNKTPEEIAVIVERSEEYVKEVLGI